MDQQDSIVALASGPGRGDRAVVRVSGPAVGALCGRLVEGAPGGRGVARVGLRLGDLLCPAVALRALAGASYTGEETLELVIPGNPHLVERVIRALCDETGVRRAGPGEFTARAYLNGRMSLAEAEGVSAVIAARSEAELESARRLESGETGRVYLTWAAEIGSLLALVEAGIDFTDQEDVVAITPRELDSRASALAADLRRLAGAGDLERLSGGGALVALVGEPNAGKSTLFNALLGRERSVVSERPGATRDAVVEELDLGDGLVARLADLPGLEAAAEGSAARAAQERARDLLAEADAIVWCDPRAEFSPAAAPLAGREQVVRVRTKADLPRAADAPAGDLAVCALDGWRLDALRLAIADAVRAAGLPVSVTLARHAIALRAGADALDRAAAAVDPDARSLAEPELVAQALREALDALEDVLGVITPDEVIGRIFATFCVGK